jgi:hypothetical protein
MIKRLASLLLMVVTVQHIATLAVVLPDKHECSHMAQSESSATDAGCCSEAVQSCCVLVCVSPAGIGTTSGTASMAPASLHVDFSEPTGMADLTEPPPTRPPD